MLSLARIGLIAWLLVLGQARAAAPLADTHVHYKWSQREVTAPERAVAILRENDIALAVVIGTPAEYALELAHLAPDVVVPLWSPYREADDWSRWPYDEEVLERAGGALATGRYRGIGELHLIGGFAPHWRSPVIQGLFALAGEHDVPLLLHTELSSNDYMLHLCRAFPQVRLVWAHAGAILSPAEVAEVMDACPQLTAELSARDPWRFVNNPISDDTGALTPQWRSLIERYPDRFMIGSDPVWPVEQLDGWDRADTGWQEYSRFIGFHRRWLDALPPDLAGKLRLDNAIAVYGRANR